MRYTGRIIASLGIFAIHSLYVVYYYVRDAKVETLDLATFPFLMVVAYLAGLQYDKVRYLSDMDSLTGLYNRRFVVNSFPKIAALTDRSHSKLFVLVIDCDDFKDINDKYGHNNGDTVLEKIGVLLLSVMRKSDVVARWGGDEFLIIGHHKEEPGVNNIIQRLHNRFHKLSEELQIPVNVSIGSAIYPDDAKNLFELIKIADQNMYSSKLTKKEQA